MFRYRLILVLLFISVLTEVHAQSVENIAVEKPVKILVQSIRYSKDLAALKQFAYDTQGKFLCGEYWDKATPAQRTEFKQLFSSVFGKIAFPKIRDNFKNLAYISYEPAEVNGVTARVKSTIAIDHPMKKQELKLSYSLVMEGSVWKVLDVTVLGDSMLMGIRDDLVRPLLKQGGLDHLLAEMRKKDSELLVTIK